MAERKYNQNPTVTDKIIFDLYTPDSNGCFFDDPAYFDSIKIFFIARNSAQTKDLATTESSFNNDLYVASLEADQDYCETPTEDYLKKKERAQQLLNASTTNNISYYTTAQPVYCGGLNCSNSDSPLWINGATNEDSPVQKDATDAFPYGKFKFVWFPNGSIMEGDYFICYSYRTTTYGNSLGNYLHFYVAADIQNEVAVPTHATPPEKYKTLLETYTPDMYKMNYAVEDKSVTTIDNLNNSVAGGFTEIEDQATRLIDILDANATPEPFLPLLSRFFGLTLTTTDPTRWRGQIISAVPLYKQKGTLTGLKRALALSGINLKDYEQYYQVTSPYSYTENFIFIGDYSFDLKKISLSIGAHPDTIGYSSIFELYLRTATGDYEDLTANITNYVSITTSGGVSTLVWNDNTRKLTIGDSIKITYQTEVFPSVQEYNNYVNIFLELPLQDTRDDRDFQPPNEIYPLINWNVRLISKNNAGFSSLIPTANPAGYPLTVFGKIRTLFPYSENVYNMDEYNGSLRDTTNPKDMNKDYLEACSGFISSHYSLDIEIENLSTFRIKEFQDVITSYTPFHSVLHSLSIGGAINEYILPPVETIEIFIRYDFEQLFVAGMAQYIFRRNLYYTSNLFTDEIVRTEMANSLGSVATGTTTLSNDSLLMAADAAGLDFKQLGLSVNPSDTQLHITSGIYAGYYQVQDPYQNKLTFTSPAINPPDNTAFDFNLSNIITSGTFGTQDASIYKISDTDTTIDYNEYGITAGYKVLYGMTLYTIKMVMNNTLYLENDGTLTKINASPVTYTVKNPSNTTTILSSTTGSYSVEIIGRLLVSEATHLVDIQSIISGCSGTIVLQLSTNTEYTWLGMDPIQDAGYMCLLFNNYDVPYAVGSIVGANLLNRLVNSGSAVFNYAGMKINRVGGMPTFVKPDDRATYLDAIPEDFYVDITIGLDTYTYYLVPEDDEYGPTPTSSYIHITGNFQPSTITGQSVTYNFYKLQLIADKQIIMTNGSVQYLDRSGQDEITSTTEAPSSLYIYRDAKNLQADGTGPVETVVANDFVQFKIEYKDGTIVEGEIK